MIRLLIVDDHPLVRRGLADLFSSDVDVEVVGVATGGAEGVALASQLRPDVVLMDLSMPDIDGVEATRQIVDAGLSARVVILTSFSERERILAAVDAGAVGYLLKDAEPEELARGVRAAAIGDSPFSPRAATALLSRKASSEQNDDVGEAATLTVREREVLRLVAGGLANKQIARELGISEKTVKAHLTSVFNSIGVTDRTQAALWAREHEFDSLTYARQSIKR